MKKSLLLLLVFVASCKNAFLEKEASQKVDKEIRSASETEDMIRSGSLTGTKCEYVNEDGIHERDILIHDISPAEQYVHQFFELEKEAGPNEVGLATPSFVTGDYSFQVVQYDQREDYGPYVNNEKIESDRNIEILYYVERDEFEIVEVDSLQGDYTIVGQFVNCEKGYEFDYSIN